MHYRHLIVVTIDQEYPHGEVEELVEGRVNEALDRYIDKVYDYYIIGGRWSGYLSGRDFIRYTEYTDLFMNELKGARRHIQSRWRELQHEIAGLPVTREDMPDWVLNPVEVLAEANGGTCKRAHEWLESRSQRALEKHKVYKTVMSLPTYEEAQSHGREVDYLAWELHSLLSCSYSTSNNFLYVDASDAHWTCPTYLRRLIETTNDAAWLNSLFMVVVDLHN